jgi:hypothetical protein
MLSSLPLQFPQFPASLQPLALPQPPSILKISAPMFAFSRLI